jgi:hypothetical protein
MKILEALKSKEICVANFMNSNRRLFWENGEWIVYHHRTLTEYYHGDSEEEAVEALLAE